MLEAGLSNFHLITVRVMRNIFKKLEPRAINYRSYKHFSNEAYRESQLYEPLKEVFLNNDSTMYIETISTFFYVKNFGEQSKPKKLLPEVLF